MPRPPSCRPRDRLPLTAALLALLLVVGSVSAPAALAQDAHEPDVPTGEIIPKPNTGEEPEEAGDRGGALQIGLLALIAAAIGGMAVYVARRSAPARAARARRVAEAQRARADQPRGTSPPERADR